VCVRVCVCVCEAAEREEILDKIGLCHMSYVICHMS
jgi:hypothetical protein